MHVSQLVKIGIFLVFLYSGMLLIFFFGDTRSISNNENRTLAKWPKWSLIALCNGQYLHALENYTADHIAYRDALVDVSKAIAAWRGLKGEAGAYIIASQANNNAESTFVPPPEKSDVTSSERPVATAFPLPLIKVQEETGRVMGKVLLVNNQAMHIYIYHPDYGKLYAETINRFEAAMAGQTGEPMHVSVLLAPTAVEFVRNPRLQKLSSSQQQAIQSIYRQMKQPITTIDALANLQAHAAEDLFFRTDHH